MKVAVILFEKDGDWKLIIVIKEDYMEEYEK